MSSINEIRNTIQRHYLADETVVLQRLMSDSGLSNAKRQQISSRATELVSRVRSESSPTMMENFLAEYGFLPPAAPSRLRAVPTRAVAGARRRRAPCWGRCAPVPILRRHTPRH